jgi:hypothetical protein
MGRSMFRSVLPMMFGAFLVTAIATPAASADKVKGEFAIEGAGTATCLAFTAARKARSAVKPDSAEDAKLRAEADSYSRFIGWVEGYLTATNRYVDDTYDISPWQNAEVYGVILGQYCEKNPQDRLFTAVQKLVIALTPDRIKAPSEKVGVSANGRVFPVYTEVIRRAQAALKKQGLYHGEVNGTYDENTAKAVVGYQAFVNVNQTGLPDALTLWLLFSPPIAFKAPGAK